MHTLVTGGAGFIGSHLVDHLLAEGHTVAVLDDLSTGRAENLAAVRDRIDFVEGDVRDGEAVRRATRGAEVIYHQAALASVPRSIEQPTLVASVNVGGTLAVLDAARAGGARRVVLASSSSVYGDVEQLPREESMLLRPRSPYAASKSGAEAFMEAYSAAFGLETAVLRYFNVYGPRQRARSRYAAAVPRFIAASLAGQAAVIEGDGEQTRDFTFVADVAEAAARAGQEAGALDGPINIGAGTRTSVKDLAAMIAEACGSGLAPEHVPSRFGDVRHAQAAITRARDCLGWSPATSLADGIAQTVAAARACDRPVESAS